VFQYSAGVAASPGHEIERVRFDKPVPLAEGFAQIAKYIQAAGRPLTSFCACELRSPAAFTDEGFRNFNLHYVKTLAEWGVYDGKTNPVARSNVCPEIDPPAEPSFYAFSLRAEPNRPSFVIAGGWSRKARQPGVRCVIGYQPEGLREGPSVASMEQPGAFGLLEGHHGEPTRARFLSVFADTRSLGVHGRPDLAFRPAAR
jgi:hypothetical protein